MENQALVFPLGPCSMSFNGADLGLVGEKGVDVKANTTLVEMMASKFGKVPIAIFLNGTDVEVDAELDQSQISVLAPLYPGATVVTSGGYSKMTFGKLAGSLLTPATLVITPLLTANTPGFKFTLSAVPVGNFEAHWNGTNYVWPVKFRGIINASLADGAYNGSFGDPTITADAVAPVVSTCVPANNAPSVDKTSTVAITWTMSKALDGSTVNTGSVHLFALPAASPGTQVALTSVVLTNNGASTTIVANFTGPLGATTKHLMVLDNTIKDQAGNALALDARQFTTGS